MVGSGPDGLRRSLKSKGIHGSMRTGYGPVVAAVGVALLAAFYIILLTDDSSCEDTDGGSGTCIGPRAPMGLFYGGVGAVLAGAVLFFVQRRRQRSRGPRASVPACRSSAAAWAHMV